MSLRDNPNIIEDISDLRRDLDELALATSSGSILNTVYPIGSVIIRYDSEDCSSFLGGTWVKFGSGQVLVGQDTNDADFDTIGETGGEKTHTLTVDEIPSHRHTLGSTNGAVGYVETVSLGNRATATYTSYTNFVGGGGAHNNLQPYIVVNFWRRTA